MLKIEILYPEVCNLYGESANVMYLKKSLKDATFINTNLNDKPKFLDSDIDLVYIGATSEKYQELIINKLMPYKDKIKSRIDNNQVILATGNAFEIFGKYIEDDNRKIDALQVFDMYSKRNFKHRHNSLFLGTFENFNVVGYKSQFSHSYGGVEGLFECIRGIGLNEEAKYEGIHYKNFFGTYLLGPILIINPYFTKYLFKLLGIADDIAFEKEAIDAYNYRLMELKNKKTSVISKH